MQATGIICEYNPLHLGHQKQLDHIRRTNGGESAIVCLMSGNFVQRGHPAVFDKTLRAKAAILCGADLVLELPVTHALSSAEGFAAGGVAILSRICTELCFGAETPDGDALMDTAQALLAPEFSPALRQHLDAGLSFPAARQAALADMGLDGSQLESPNNILAVEYCKAIVSQSSPLRPVPIHREGGYHDTTPDAANPSATALRHQMSQSQQWLDYVPQPARNVFRNAARHTLQNGEKAILARLRTMTDEEFAALPFGSEGLWRKLMHASRREASLPDILAAVKSKRYTRTRLDRMVMCAFLGLEAENLTAPAPYARVLAFNDRGRAILNRVKATGFFPNIGENVADPYQAIEHRCGSLYGLFAATAEPPKAEQTSRVFYSNL